MPRIRHKRNVITVAKKLHVVKEHLRDGTSVYGLAKKYGVQGNQVLRWVLKVTAARSPGVTAINSGRKVALPQVEVEGLAYFHHMRDADVAISTKMLILKAQNIDPSFHGGSASALTSWAYQFLRRHALSIRRPTRQGQKMSGSVTDIKNDFVASICDRFAPFGTLEGVPWDNVVNMDETPVYFEPKIHTTVSIKGAKTVSARVCASHNPRITVCLAVTASGKKLQPFVVFKGVPGARIESGLSAIVPDGMFATCQKAAFMDETTTALWTKKVWHSFAQSRSSILLLLDDYKCHKQSSLSKSLSYVGTQLDIFPGNILHIFLQLGQSYYPSQMS